MSEDDAACALPDAPPGPLTVLRVPHPILYLSSGTNGWVTPGMAQLAHLQHRATHMAGVPRYSCTETTYMACPTCCRHSPWLVIPPETCQREKGKDRVVLSHDGHNAYCLISDTCSRHTWVFLTTSKETPVNILDLFLTRHGLQGKITPRSSRASTKVMNSLVLKVSANIVSRHGYVVEPIDLDTPFAERYSRTPQPNSWYGVFSAPRVSHSPLVRYTDTRRVPQESFVAQCPSAQPLRSIL
jgi:hypothetical protein